MPDSFESCERLEVVVNYSPEETVVIVACGEVIVVVVLVSPGLPLSDLSLSGLSEEVSVFTVVVEETEYLRSAGQELLEQFT